MLRRIDRAIVLGLGLAGCGSRAIVGDTNAGDEGDDESSGTETGASTATTVSTMSTTAPDPSTTIGTVTAVTDDSADADDGNDDDDPVKYDMSWPFPDVGGPPPLSCDNPGFLPPVQGIACERDEEFADWVSICEPPTNDGECAPLDDERRLRLYECAGDFEGDCHGFYDQCGPAILEDGTCCYWGTLGQTCPGRPFVIDGRARLAGLHEGDAWCDQALAAGVVAQESPAFAARLAAAWLFDAQHEHAAIASFSRFTLQLLAVAAPPRFVDASLRAAMDEREHASLFFALAQRHGGRAWGPGPLAVDGALLGADDPIHVVVATIHEGCIAETISALQLQVARDAAEDPALREALSRVLEQELAHVDLAWAFVAWAVARGDAAMRAAVVAAFDDPARWIPRGPDAEPEVADVERWRRHGRLTEADRVAVARRAIAALVMPAARRLLAATERDGLEIPSRATQPNDDGVGFRSIS